MSEVTSKILRDKENQVICECGNITINEYVWYDHNGESQSCPRCMVDWQKSQIKALKELLFKLSFKSREITANEINKAYADIMGCEVDYFIDDIDYSIVSD